MEKESEKYIISGSGLYGTFFWELSPNLQKRMEENPGMFSPALNEIDVTNVRAVLRSLVAVHLTLLSGATMCGGTLLNNPMMHVITTHMTMMQNELEDILAQISKPPI
jgi:hypothetical protein